MLQPKEVRTRAQVELIQAPEHTRSWYPVAFGEALDVVEDTFDRKGLQVAQATYGLARKDTQLFASWDIAGDNEAHLLTIALRGSIDKSLSWSGIGGLTVSACSNLDLWSAAHKVMRKNTRQVLPDFVAMMGRVIDDALPTYEAKSRQLESWKDRPCNLDAGYRFFGQAFGHGVINTRQLSSACDSWTHSDVEEHRERNVYCLNAAMTHGLKSGSLTDTVERYSRAHDYLTGAISC